MNHFLFTFCRSLLHGSCFNEKRNKRNSLIIVKGVIIIIIFMFPSLSHGSEKKIDNLKQLINFYDPTGCQECHEEIYAQWQNSHHARSISDIFMDRYLKKGPFSVRIPEEATKKNFPCFKCHLPQIEKTTDAVAAEIAAVILNNDKTTMQKLNISCMVCHRDKSVVHGLPESSVMYGPKAEKEYPEEEHMRVKKSPFMKQAAMCGQCHGLGPIFEFEHPVQCGTLYGSYLHAYIPSGGTQTCQECHMENDDHTCPPNFNNRTDVSKRLKQSLPMEVNILSYQFQPFEKQFVPTIVVMTKITSEAGHRIPDG